MSGRSLADARHKKGRRLHHPTTVPPADCRSYPYPLLTDLGTVATALRTVYRYT